MEQLPIDDHLAAIRDHVRADRAVVISAPPGAGKTTRVPVFLAVDGPVIVLQPRRVAARAIARRIAEEQGWTLGDEIGWHVRFERHFSPRTRVLLATEGILTARLQQDPLLSAFRTVVLDEFHERSVHADLGLALARQAWRARDDLRLVVMSATLDTGVVARFLDDCRVVRVPGRLHPVTVDYRPDQTIAAAIAEMLNEAPGNVLCFLPGAPEIRRVTPDVERAVGDGVGTLPLHGSLAADEQDRAITAAGRSVILATNIAETSLTVRGVTSVVDTGLQKVARYDPDRGIDSLETERITRDSADQRAGRAGRLGPGRVRRLWNELDTLRPHREAEIHRIDLSEPVLAVRAWGQDPATFEWFERPDEGRIAAAEHLLQRLGALENGLLTDIGRELQRLPLHPRLARMLIDSDGDPGVAVACALLSERHFVPARAASTASDLLSAVEDERRLPPGVVAIGRRLATLVEANRVKVRNDREGRFLHAVFVGYPDRVARRRHAGSSRFVFASGTGGVLAPESGVHNAEFVVAVDVQAGRRGEGSEARIRLASAIDSAWVTPTRIATEHEVNGRTGRVRAVERAFYDELLLRERAVEPDSAEVSRLLAEAYRKLPPPAEDVQLQRRLRFAGLVVAFEALVTRAASSSTCLSEISPEAGLDWNMRRDLDRMAPKTLIVPSGRAVRLDYQEDGTITAAVKLQELFGLGDSPRLGPQQTPVVFSLLAPSGRPVQTTSDLRSFWNTTYQQIRPALRGRYPKHPWPEDPWTATATGRAIRKRT